jgi:hypothetical protein
VSCFLPRTVPSRQACGRLGHLRQGQGREASGAPRHGASEEGHDSEVAREIRAPPGRRSEDRLHGVANRAVEHTSAVQATFDAEASTSPARSAAEAAYPPPHSRAVRRRHARKRLHSRIRGRHPKGAPARPEGSFKEPCRACSADRKRPVRAGMTAVPEGIAITAVAPSRPRSGGWRLQWHQIHAWLHR